MCSLTFNYILTPSPHYLGTLVTDDFLFCRFITCSWPCICSSFCLPLLLLFSVKIHFQYYFSAQDCQRQSYLCSCHSTLSTCWLRHSDHTACSNLLFTSHSNQLSGGQTFYSLGSTHSTWNVIKWPTKVCWTSTNNI